MNTCDKHGDKYITILNGTCKKCMEESENVKKLTELILNLQKKANIPFRYINSTFDNYKCITNKSYEVVKSLKEYTFSSNILLLGSTGTGKTHLACALLNNLILNNRVKECRYTQYYKLAAIRIKDRTELDAIINTGFLIIDEIGVSSNDFASNLLFEIINERYNNRKCTMLISNLNGTAIKESISPALQSRLKENLLFLNCTWDDYRIKTQD